MASREGGRARCLFCDAGEGSSHKDSAVPCCDGITLVNYHTSTCIHIADAAAAEQCLKQVADRQCALECGDDGTFCCGSNVTAQRGEMCW